MNINRRYFLRTAAASLVLGTAGTATAKRTAARPNVLFLFTDDQRNDTIHALGNTHIKTPNLDRLVNSGTTFKNAYIMGASSPAVCAPSRACLMSGRTLWNAECQGIWSSNLMNQKIKSMPEVFKDNGYVSFGTGKQHNGKESFARSFNAGDKILFRGMTSNQYDLPLNAYSPTGDYGKSVQHKGTHSAEVYATAAVKFLEEQTKNKDPFFAYISFQTPHDPRQCPKDYMAMYKPADIPLPESFKPEHPFDNGMLRIRDEGLARFPRNPDEIKKHIAAYYAMVTHTDAQIGRILDALEKSGKMKNTIIVFASDNGLAVGRHGLMGKQNVYDHSVHVPLIISGPGIPKGELREQLCYVYDIYPTLCDLAGLPTPETVQFKSLGKAIDSRNAQHRKQLAFGFMQWQRAVQNEKYKLIEYCVKGKRHSQLFDLTNDPMELNNLAGEPKYASTLELMRTLLKEESVRLNDGNTPFKFADKQGKEFWKTYESVAETTIP